MASRVGSFSSSGVVEVVASRVGIFNSSGVVEAIELATIAGVASIERPAQVSNSFVHSCDETIGSDVAVLADGRGRKVRSVTHTVLFDERHILGT